VLNRSETSARLWPTWRTSLQAFLRNL